MPFSARIPPLSRPLARPLTKHLQRTTRFLSSSTPHLTTPPPRHVRARIPIPPPFPVTPTCPSPTCACAPMPAGLDIDTAQDLNGTMAGYSQQVVISTGREDWASRIEEDGVGEGWGEVGRGLKGLLGRGGEFMDPYNNVMLTNSSFTPSPATTTTTTSASASASALLLPSFTYIPSLPTTPQSLSTFTRAYLLPTTPHPAHASLPEHLKPTLPLRDTTLLSSFPAAQRLLRTPVILICGHGGRDHRCGVMGPLLQAEFTREFTRRGMAVSRSPGEEGGNKDDGRTACVAQISHVGGHKYAGNVIVYVPPEQKGENERSELAGCGVWYGRVEPRHVEGIVGETLGRGRVIGELFRGGIGREGGILRL